MAINCSYIKIKMWRKISLLWVLSFMVNLSKQQALTLNTLKTARDNHRARQLSDLQLQKIASLGNTTQFRQLLSPILVPRVVGTEGHENVKQHLVQFMQSLGWDVEQDSFSAETPIGRLPFSNVVARLNSQASRYLVLACHYDSKLMNNFVGATDSAVPCAMMLHIAKALAEPLRNSQEDVSLKFIFFDGEEAFDQWGPNDSIYGAKHLAQKLHSLPYRSDATHLNRMDMLVLLDLIGVSNPRFFSYFRNTEQWYLLLANAEKRLTSLRLLSKRVPIVHLIPNPFPSVWHTPQDNLASLDFRTINDLNKILSVFVAEYLKLNI
ncbi:hypothetical protein B566_EDAN014386 [Ephemera danica]|nr:hypothetical protein B566_EDAN014386 [Ephemera danica]